MMNSVSENINNEKEGDLATKDQKEMGMEIAEQISLVEEIGKYYCDEVSFATIFLSKNKGISKETVIRFIIGQVQIEINNCLKNTQKSTQSLNDILQKCPTHLERFIACFLTYKKKAEEVIQSSDSENQIKKGLNKVLQKAMAGFEEIAPKFMSLKIFRLWELLSEYIIYLRDEKTLPPKKSVIHIQHSPVAKLCRELCLDDGDTRKILEENFGPIINNNHHTKEKTKKATNEGKDKKTTNEEISQNLNKHLRKQTFCVKIKSSHF